MKSIFFVFLAMMLIGASYTTWRVYNILPLSNVLKTVASVLVWLPLVAVIIYGTGVIDRLPMDLSSIVYNVGIIHGFLFCFTVSCYLVY